MCWPAAWCLIALAAVGIAFVVFTLVTVVFLQFVVQDLKADERTVQLSARGFEKLTLEFLTLLPESLALISSALFTGLVLLKLPKWIETRGTHT